MAEDGLAYPVYDVPMLIFFIFSKGSIFIQPLGKTSGFNLRSRPIAQLVQIPIEPEVATETLKNSTFPQAKILTSNSLCEFSFIRCRSLDNPVWTAALNWQKAEAAL
jgi:hypothetical protein